MRRDVDVLIDADPLVYRVGFALEKREYYLQWVDVDPAHPHDRGWDRAHVARFENADRRDETIRLLALDPEEYGWELVSIPETNEAIVFGRVKQSLTDIEHRVGAHLYEHGQRIRNTRIFLTGGGNFREDVATIAKYKGSRDRSVRPYWYEGIREYLIKYRGAEVTDGFEADDAVSMIQWDGDLGDTIICTIDKDLLNVPGHHYNYVRKEACFVTKKEARLRFYRQIIEGDRTDDIPGCFHLGPAAAREILPTPAPAKELWWKVLDTYAVNLQRWPAHHGPYGKAWVAGHMSLEAAAWESARENGRLLWMLQHPDQLWNPPGTPHGSIARDLLPDPDRGLNG